MPRFKIIETVIAYVEADSEKKALAKYIADPCDFVDEITERTVQEVAE